MSNKNIHPSAVIEPGAKLGKDVTIEPYAIVKENVTLGDGVTIKSHAYIDGYTTIGAGTTVYPSASIGTKTQDKKFYGEKTEVIIGENCEIREFVTINSSCGENSYVKVGDDCLVMAYCHIAHNCELGKGVIMANGAMLAGHVIVEDYANIGGMTPIHQWVRVGSYAMVGGFSRITHDIPPYTLGAGSPYKLGGLNLVGLKRHGFSLDVRQELTRAFRLTYRSKMHLNDALEKLKQEYIDSTYIQHWIEFAKTSKRGLIGLERHSNDMDDVLEDLEVLLEEKR
ncbi:MAG: acyl-ACP--UDP-N-acetylglucosamine O-acyltransferase [Simkaniaceae bacterium]|nr:acyl-ACP--UDP-N-acetylglucosamine O-acyltransferase [Simkaniaceae bacterium]